jgi:hypothetical protein
MNAPVSAAIKEIFKKFNAISFESEKEWTAEEIMRLCREQNFLK